MLSLPTRKTMPAMRGGGMALIENAYGDVRKYQSRSDAECRIEYGTFATIGVTSTIAGHVDARQNPPARVTTPPSDQDHAPR